MSDQQLLEEVRELTWGIEQGTATASNVDQLDQLITDDLAARRIYLEYSRLLSDLRFEQVFGEWKPEPELVEPERARSRVHKIWKTIDSNWGVSLTLSAMVTLSIVLTLALFTVQFGGGENNGPGTDAKPQWVARITATSGCRWSVAQADGTEAIVAETPGERTRQGYDLLLSERLVLVAGVAEVTFDDGARALLTGPAEFTILGGNQLELLAGQLTARVPARAVGFRVDAPSLRAIDLGTEFAVEVSPLGWTELHVFQGSVQAAALTSDGNPYWNQPLTANQAVRINHASAGDGSGKPTRFAAQPIRFNREIRPSMESSLVGFYPFEGDGNDASGRANHASLLSNVTFESGHSGQAAKFAGTVDSYIDLPINARVANMPRMTWGCWVRIDSLSPEGNELISTDNGGYDRILTIDQRGGEEPRDRFAMMVGNQQVAPCLEVEPLLGEWTFVACVYDGPSGKATLYVEQPADEDGTRLLAVTERSGVRIGRSHKFIRLGMHAGGGPEPLDGAMDNVFVFETALSASQLDEIRSGGIEALR